MVSVPVHRRCSPTKHSHDVGNIGEKIGFLVKLNGPAHAGEGRVGGVEIVVPKLVARFISIGCHVENEGSPLTQAVVGSLDEVEGGVHGVARQLATRKKPYLLQEKGSIALPASGP